MGFKKKVLYCSNCKKDTVHNLVCTESALEGAGLGRVLGAIFTFGQTETTLADKHYECSKCGELTKE